MNIIFIIAFLLSFAASTDADSAEMCPTVGAISGCNVEVKPVYSKETIKRWADYEAEHRAGKSGPVIVHHYNTEIVTETVVETKVVEVGTPVSITPFLGIGVNMFTAADHARSDIESPTYEKHGGAFRSNDNTRGYLEAGIEVSKGMFGGYGKVNNNFASIGGLFNTSLVTVFAGVTSMTVWSHEDMDSYMGDKEQHGKVGMACETETSIPFEAGIHTNGRVQFVASIAQAAKTTTCSSFIASGITTTKELKRNQDTTNFGIGIRINF